jgi:ATP-dependent Zn protease
MERSWQDIDIYLANARAQASALLNEHWPWVEAVAKALIERKTLTGDEVLALRP